MEPKSRFLCRCCRSGSSVGAVGEAAEQQRKVEPLFTLTDGKNNLQTSISSELWKLVLETQWVEHQLAATQETLNANTFLLWVNSIKRTLSAPMLICKYRSLMSGGRSMLQSDQPNAPRRTDRSKGDPDSPSRGPSQSAACRGQAGSQGGRSAPGSGRLHLSSWKSQQSASLVPAEETREWLMSERRRAHV